MPSPLTFEPLLFPKVWGGDRLARFGKAVSPGSRIGESWEVCDLAATSASGAGGAAAMSVVAAGPLKGRSLHEVLQLWGQDLLGARRSTAEGRFPLLVKYLDARENLSVQVHPSPAYARAHSGAHLKTECWYVLEAEAGSVIYKGVRAGVTRESFERHLREGDGAAVVGDLEAVAAVPGEMHLLPSGTVHALGGGVLVAEIQAPSDTTFRVYDWGRRGREMHAKEALECIEFGRALEATRAKEGAAGTRLASTGHFTVDEQRIGTGEAAAVGGERCVVLMVVRGSGEVASIGGAFTPVAAPIGATVVVPAVVAETAEIRAWEEMRVRKAEVV
jgi:mannose-6-phosphate isomerase